MITFGGMSKIGPAGSEWMTVVTDFGNEINDSKIGAVVSNRVKQSSFDKKLAFKMRRMVNNRV